MMNTMDLYNEQINNMWEPALGIEPGSTAWKARRVTARPPPLPLRLGSLQLKDTNNVTPHDMI